MQFNLSTCSPTEIAVLLNKKAVSNSDLLRYTLFHLVINRVIQPKEFVQEIESRSGRTRVNKIHYFEPDIKFEDYNFKDYERKVLTSFFNKENPKIPVKKIVFQIKSEYQQDVRFHYLILNSSFLKKINRRFLWIKMRWSSKGKAFQKNVKNELARIENLLLKNENIDNEEALEIYKCLGTNIILLDSFSTSFLKKIQPHLEFEDDRYRTDWLDFSDSIFAPVSTIIDFSVSSFTPSFFDVGDIF